MNNIIFVNNYDLLKKKKNKKTILIINNFNLNFYLLIFY